MKYPWRTVLLLLGLALQAFAAPPAPATNGPILWPGTQQDGSMLLPNQWSLRPAGIQIELGDFPVNIAVHPDGQFAAVLHCGYGKHEIIVVDIFADKVVSQTPVPEAFYGIEFSRDGKQLFCSGSSDETIYAFRFERGTLSSRRRLPLRPVRERGVPSGIAVDPSGNVLYAANLWTSRISRVDLASGAVRDLILSPADASLAVLETVNADADTLAATKRERAAGESEDPNATFAYDCVLDAKRDRLYVSLWGQGAIAVLDVKAGKVVAHWATGAHPCELALRRDGRFLFTANANDNTVSVFDTRTGRAVETLWATMYANSPRGATPNSLALSPRDDLLFVANANINAVAVFDVSKPGRSRCLGFIPTGWYPTSVRVTPDGRRLLVANGKGVKAMANPEGPQPVRGASMAQYIGQLFRGTLSIVDLPSRRELPRQVARWTSITRACTPLRPDEAVVAARPPGNPIPGRVGEPSPIKHCIFIVKENRTYDQVLGDMPEGNGDPKLCLFPERVTPNHHRLAREFVLLDNFYVESEVSADGHEWTMAAYATDFVEKTWPLNYGHAKSGKFPYPSEGLLDVSIPSSGYLWDRAREAGVSYRSYGEFIQDGRTTSDPGTTRLKSLQGHFDPWYRSFDLNYPDAKRADRFIAELRRFEAEGDMPRLQVLRLPNDHTHGVTPGALTPAAYVADNDLALGRVVEAVSHSRFWPDTAIFVVEDDAQSGPDHVDAHRTVALVISPYTRRHAVDSTLYSTSSMLRTMELILGLRPMTQFDAAAVPMFNLFQSEPDLTGYAAIRPEVDMKARNGLASWGADIHFNFAKEDAADDLLFNEVIWRAVKGADHPMPGPVRAGFVFTRPDGDDD